MSKIKILITGATGNLGNRIIQNIVSNNEFELIASDIDQKIAERFSWYSKVTFIEYNLKENRQDLYTLFLKPDRVIHLSWHGLPNYNKLHHIEENFINNFFFLKNLIEHGLKNLTTIGTCFEYGIVNGCLSEEMDTNPVTYYGIAKDTLRKV
ncbi:MAG: NAD(P)-dependent oxidoreductase, partial [Chitinivibrionales bacterium]|nr:NAD(P)-dependent oxidoreductase [Chitinivibrionales bacterium]